MEAGDPAAIASRRDLVWINCLMGNTPWFEKQLRALPRDSRLLEIGAGDGTLARRLMTNCPELDYTAVDLAPQPHDWPAEANWHQGDLYECPHYADADALLACLILHHFEDETLKRFGQIIEASSLRRILVCEPCRRHWHKWQLQLGRLLGFNAVTLHDGCVSIEAGFRGEELPQRLNLEPGSWHWQIEENFMGAYRMEAVRR